MDSYYVKLTDIGKSHLNQEDIPTEDLKDNEALIKAEYSMISSGTSLQEIASAEEPLPFFTVNIPPLMNVMTALVLAFTLGLGIAALDSTYLKNVANLFDFHPRESPFSVLSLRIRSFVFIQFSPRITL